MTAALLPCVITAKTMVCHVDGRFQGENYNGESWSSAYPNLQEAINTTAANGGGEIWIRAGIYKPTGNGRQATFELKPGVELYGGFRGAETEREARNPKANRTILSGDIGRISVRSDNSYHILTGASHSRIDGFIISGGNANGQKAAGCGGGLRLPDNTKKFTAANCTFEKNNALLGGGLYAKSAELLATNCIFYSNSAENGGALAADGSTALRIQNSFFSSNFAPQAGGAVSLQSGADANFAHTSFLYNSSDGNGGALHAANASAALSDCIFKRNAATQGAGVLAALDGATIQTNACTYTGNKSAKEMLNTFADETSAISDGSVKLATSQPAPETVLSPTSTPAAETDTHPKRALADLTVLKPDGSEVNLRSLVANSKFTVLCLGDLTDAAFLKHCRDIEAAARDYKNNGVRFFHIYRHLAHPENHGYIQPFTLRERQRHAVLATKLLHTNIPWLVDPIDNPAAQTLVAAPNQSAFIFNQAGREEYAGDISATTELRRALNRLAGTIDTPTRPGNLAPPAPNPISTPKAKLVERVKVDVSDRFVPLKITPQNSKHPFYVKARIEGTRELIETGNGNLYLGFHIDPIYNVAWNNLETPMKYALKTPAGVVAPSINSAPRITGQATDAEPREFRIEARQLDPAKPLALQLSYPIHSTSTKRTVNITQQYLIQLEPDPFGGKVFGRQISAESTKSPQTAQSAQTGKSRFDVYLKKMDLNRDGKISEAEAIGPLRRLFKTLDTNKDGFVEREEYLAYKNRNAS